MILIEIKWGKLIYGIPPSVSSHLVGLNLGNTAAV